MNLISNGSIGTSAGNKRMSPTGSFFVAWQLSRFKPNTKPNLAYSLNSFWNFTKVFRILEKRMINCKLTNILLIYLLKLWNGRPQPIFDQKCKWTWSYNSNFFQKILFKIVNSFFVKQYLSYLSKNPRFESNLKEL